MDKHFCREEFYIKSESDSLLAAWEQHDMNMRNARSSDPIASQPQPQSHHQQHQQQQQQHDEHSNDHESFSVSRLAHASSSSSQQTARANIVKLVNKKPDWNKKLNSFVLNFNGRVAVGSSKNFQLVHPKKTDYITMQFGKINKDLYTCDYSYPFCGLQAFAIALTSLINKLGCD